jgi:hypothetical protein
LDEPGGSEKNMGYFGCAYVVEGTADANGVSLITTVYSADGLASGKALFFWSEGERPGRLFSYAKNTLYCTERLSVLPGYPTSERRGHGAGENPNLILVEEDFTPQSLDEPVIFHFVLPSRFVPCPNLAPLITPSRPSIIQRDNYLTATFVASGRADIRFWIRRLDAGVGFDAYNVSNLFDKPAVRSAKAKLEVNLGILKFSFGE